MYKLCLILCFVTSSLAFPQKKNDNLDDMIEAVFEPDRRNGSTTASPSSTEESIDDLFDKIFGSDDSKNTSSTTKRYGGLVKTGEECVLINQNGVCVKYYLCQNEFSSDDGVIDIHAGEEHDCESYLDVCCAKDKVTDEIPV